MKQNKNILKSININFGKFFDLLYAIQWSILILFGITSWKDLKSWKYKNRKGIESEHRESRIVDDVSVVKYSKYVGNLLVWAFEKNLFNSQSLQEDFKGEKLSVIIPFSSDSEGIRIKLLKTCVKRINNLLPQAELIISSCVNDKESINKNFSQIKNIKIITQVEKKIDFNVASAINLGVKNANYGNLCILQADIYLNNDIIFIAKEFINSSKDYFFPAIGVMFLDQSSTDLLISKNIFKPRLGSYCRELESYLLFIKKIAFERIGGFNCEFSQPGEDNDFYDRLSILNPIENRKTAIYHLWHPPFWKRNTEALIRNRDLLFYVRKIPIERRIKYVREAYKNIV